MAGEYCLSSAYLIHNFYKTIMSRLFWAQENESHKGFCLQIHLRTCQVDHDCKAIRAEYLHREPSLDKNPFFSGLNLITSSRIVG